MRYKIGNIVRVKPDLEFGYYESKEFVGTRLMFASEMRGYRDKIFEVIAVEEAEMGTPEVYVLNLHGDDDYNNSHWVWSSEMLIPEDERCIAYWLNKETEK